MSGTVVGLSWFTNGADNSSCDAGTNWGGLTVDSESKIQGTACNSQKVSSKTSTYVYTLGSPINLVGQNIYVWMMCLTPSILGARSAGGMRIRVEDASAYYREWYVAGNDTYKGGWQCYCVNTGVTPNGSSATPAVLTAITKVGVTFYTTGATSKLNCLWDAMRYGTGMQIKGGTSGSPATFQDIFTEETSNVHGVFTDVGGAYLVQGNIIIGSQTSGETTYFSDATGPVFIFRNRPLGATPAYNINLVGNPTAETEIYLGAEVGGTGVLGPVIKCESGEYRYKVNADNQWVTKFGLLGCMLYNPDVITLPSYNADKKMLGSNVIAGKMMQPSTSIVQKDIYASAPQVALQLPSSLTYLKTNQFINCQTGVKITVSGEYSFDAMLFSGNTYDVENSSAGLVTINCSNNSNPVTVNNTGGGSTTIVNTYYHRITGLQQNSEVTYVRKSDNTVLYHEEDVDETGQVQYEYSYTSDTEVDILIHHLNYVFYVVTVTLSNANQILPVVQVDDPNYL